MQVGLNIVIQSINSFHSTGFIVMNRERMKATKMVDKTKNITNT